MVLILGLTLVSAQENQQELQNPPVWNAEIIPLCNFGACLEGNFETFQVTVNNLGQEGFQLQGLVLTDNMGLTFARIDLSQEQVIVPVGQSATVNVPGLIPPPTRGSTLYYVINYVVNGQVFPDNSFRTMAVMPLSDMECMNNDFCDGSNVCFGYRCMPYSMFNSSVVPKPTKSLGADNFMVILLFIVIALLVVITFLVHGKSGKRR